MSDLSAFRIDTRDAKSKSDRPRDYATTLRSLGETKAAKALETMRIAEKACESAAKRREELEEQIMSFAIKSGDAQDFETLKSQYRESVEESVAANEQLQKAGMYYVRVTPDEYPTLSYQEVETSYAATKEHITYMSPRIMGYRPWRLASSDRDAGVAADVASSQAMTMEMCSGRGTLQADDGTTTQPHGTKRRWEPGSDDDDGEIVFKLKL